MVHPMDDQNCAGQTEPWGGATKKLILCISKGSVAQLSEGQKRACGAKRAGSKALNPSSVVSHLSMFTGGHSPLRLGIQTGFVIVLMFGTKKKL